MTDTREQGPEHPEESLPELRDVLIERTRERTPSPELEEHVVTTLRTHGTLGIRNHSRDIKGARQLLVAGIAAAAVFASGVLVGARSARAYDSRPEGAVATATPPVSVNTNAKVDRVFWF